MPSPWLLWGICSAKTPAVDAKPTPRTPRAFAYLTLRIAVIHTRGPGRLLIRDAVYDDFLGPYLNPKGQFGTFCIYQPALPPTDSFSPSRGPGETSNGEENPEGGKKIEMERSPPPQSGLHLFRVADIHKGVRDHSEAPQLQSRRHLEFLHITWRLPFSRFLDES